MTALEARLRRAAHSLEAWRDVLDERADGVTPPSWASRRGWETWLTRVDDDLLQVLEAAGAVALVAAADAPEDLRALAQQVVEVVGGASSYAAPRGARKQAQVDALVARCRALDVRPARVVDVGAGRGDLTRALAAALGVAALGLERDAALVRRARASTRGRRATFEEVDVLAADMTFARGDLLVGLHACGGLGDALVAAAARDGAHALLVACCPQKVSATARAPASALGRDLGLVLPRDLLGLANAPAGAPDLYARTVRHAVRRLLRARGVSVGPGDEARGVPPRAWRDLALAASAALSARGLPEATATERAQALDAAREDVARARRWSFPRRLLGSALEAALALDRGRALEEAGAVVEVGPLFPRALSPRNLGVVARARS